MTCKYYQTTMGTVVGEAITIMFCEVMSLCFTKHYAMKMYWGVGYSSTHY